MSKGCASHLLIGITDYPPLASSWPSLIIIFALLVWLLGGEVFPGWHPDWSAGLSWITGFAAGILFFVSLLLHELAHSMVARNFGISVPRITLFLFGGIAEIEDEPNAPKTEFFIAIAGPVTSLLLGVIFSLLASNLAGPEFAEALLEDQKAALAELAPLPTLLFWLGPINIVLGLFNLVPGFPLDGGRVLRAALWWMTGDLDRATRSASEAVACSVGFSWRWAFTRRCPARSYKGCGCY